MDAWSSNPVLTCRSCGTELPSDAKFCWECGTPASATPAPSPDLLKAPAKQLHNLLGSLYDQGHYDDWEIKQLLARFPDAVNEPVGKERPTALHLVAYGNVTADTADKSLTGDWRQQMLHT